MQPLSGALVGDEVNPAGVAAHEQEALSRALMDGSVDAVYLLDPVSLRILHANRAFYRLLGFEQPPERLRLTDFARMPAGEVGLCVRNTDRRGGRVIGVVEWHRTDGTAISVRLSASPVLWQGRTVHLCMAYDVEAPSRALQESEARLQRQSETLHLLQQVLHHMQLGVHVWDQIGHRWFLAASNPAGSLFLGQPMEQVLDEPLEIACPALQETLPAILSRVLESSAPLSEEVCYRDREDVTHLLNMAAFPLGSNRVGVILQDLTEKRCMEIALREAQERGHQAQKLEAIGRLAGGVAHDFNNILSVILGCAAVLTQDLQPTHPLQQEAQQIRTSAEHAARLTRQLLTFSRNQMPQPQVLDVNQAVSDLGGILRRIIHEGIDVSLNLCPQVPTVLIDSCYLEQIILSLTTNAQEAMPQGGRLHLETAVAAITEGSPTLAGGVYVVISVSDTGHGMTPEVRARAFEPFFTTRPDGTGLGLATVHGIVKQARGEVRVESELNRGTTFKVYLPAHGTPSQPPRIESRSRPGRQERILVVEDDAGLRHLISRALLRGGYQVLQAGHGVAALQQLADMPEAIHMVVSDVVMPQMGGVELLERLRSMHPELPVLLMSGYADQEVLQRIPSEAALLHKPFTPDVLLKRVRATLDA
ncbi:MAG: ATP-binding protein, partial [Candidatus Xenobia bacterium]